MGSATYVGGSHLTFIKKELKKGRKLHEYIVRNHNFNDNIGMIFWRGGWRQYVFQADSGINMSRSCQKEIIKFIDKLMKDWRQRLKKEKKTNENNNNKKQL